VKIQIVTLFPEMFAGALLHSMVGRAIRRGLLDVGLVPLRWFGVGSHRLTDDYPYGGGVGMLLRVDVVVPAVEWALARGPDPARILLTSPQGRRLDQALARELATARHLVVVAGHYEGIDARVGAILPVEEVSLGDVVLTGGEIPAMALVDAVARLLPGVLGDPASAREESFGEASGWLEGPQYTRPAAYRGHEVPKVLLSGDHRRIAEWRRSQALAVTRRRRPDLLAGGKAASEEGSG
jgi:tRNA (guanine37-N1)-methyltransferase